MFLHTFVKMVKKKKLGKCTWKVFRNGYKDCKWMDFWIKENHESAFLKEKLNNKKRIF